MTLTPHVMRAFITDNERCIDPEAGRIILRLALAETWANSVFWSGGEPTVDLNRVSDETLLAVYYQVASCRAALSVPATR